MKSNNHKDFGIHAVKVKKSHVVDDQDGWRRVYDPETTEHVRLFIDVDAIVNNLAARAINSKSGKSKFMAGAVIVHHIKSGGAK